MWFARVACSTVVTLCAADSSFVQLPARESCCKEKKKKNSRRKKKKEPQKKKKKRYVNEENSTGKGKGEKKTGKENK